MRFLADQTVGSLAKWLRLCGFDTQSIHLRRDALAQLPPPAPDCRILTRHTGLARLSRRPDLLVVPPGSVEVQLTALITTLGLSLDASQPLSRCSQCNLPLVTIDHESATGRVPEHIFQTHHIFVECPGCHRLFWEGSHLTAMRRRLSRLPGTALSTPPGTELS